MHDDHKKVLKTNYYYFLFMMNIFPCFVEYRAGTRRKIRIKKT